MAMDEQRRAAIAFDDKLRAERAEEEATGYSAKMVTKRNAADLIYKTTYQPPPESDCFNEEQAEALVTVIVEERKRERAERTQELAVLKAELAELRGKVDILTALLGKQRKRINV